MYLYNLRGILAELYPNASDASRLADDAELNKSLIDFTGSAENVWQGVLSQAVNEEKINQLLSFVVEEYPSNSKFLLAAWTYSRDAEHIIAVSNGEYGEYDEYDMNGNSGGGINRLDSRIDRISADLSKLSERIIKLEYQVESLMRSSSSATALDSRTLIIAALVALAMFVVLWAMRA